MSRLKKGQKISAKKPTPFIQGPDKETKNAHVGGE